MLIQNSPARTGMLAGVIAMMIALTAMELISWMVAPWRMVSRNLPYLFMDATHEFTGSLIHFLFRGNPQFRFTVVILILFLGAAAYLGRWTAMTSSGHLSRALQSGAILCFITITLIYIAEQFWFEWYLQEMLLSLVIPFFVFAIVLARLLDSNSTPKQWQFAGMVAGVGLIFIAYEVTTNRGF